MRIPIATGVLLFSILQSPTTTAEPLNASGEDILGHAVRLEDARGRVMAITFASRFTGGEAEQVNKALMREVSPGVGMVSVVDFVGIPQMLYGLARNVIATWTPKTPAQLVIDEHGLWRSRLGAVPDKQVDILVLNRQGELCGHFVGVRQVEDARRLIRELTAG
jgi:hypothetical protein